MADTKNLNSYSLENTDLSNPDNLKENDVISGGTAKQPTKEEQAAGAFESIFGNNMVIHVVKPDGSRGMITTGEVKDLFAKGQTLGDTAVYVNDDGTVTRTPKVSMTFKDGKIKISAPKEIQESDWFKEQYLSDTFKSLATAYDKDPTGKTEIEYDHYNVDTKQWEKKKNSINELLEEYSTQLQDNTTKYRDTYIRTRNQWNKLTNGAINWTDSQLTRLFNSNEISYEASHNDKNAVVEIPDWADKYFRNSDGSEYEGYDSEKKTISTEDFYKWYSIASDRGLIAGKDAAEAMNDLSYGLQGHLSDILNQVIADQAAGGKSDEKQTEELLKTYSLMKVLQKNQPHIDFFNGVNYMFESFSAGLANMTAHII